MKFLEYYDCTFNYHLGKVNVMADALSHKAQVTSLMMRKWHMLEEVEINENLSYDDRPVKLLNRKVKELRRKQIPQVNVL